MRRRGRENHRAYYLYGGLALAAVGLVLAAALFTMSAAAQGDPEPFAFPESIYVYVFYQGVSMDQILPTPDGASDDCREGSPVDICYQILPEPVSDNGITYGPGSTPRNRRLSGTPTAVAATKYYTLYAFTEVDPPSDARASTTLSVTVMADRCDGADGWRTASDGTVLTPSLDLIKDCNILLSAKDELRGSAALNWDEETDITDWVGVFHDGSRVTELRLHNQSLTGAIPEQLGGLSSLTHLDLHDNQLTGGIPGELGSLSSLVTLNLSDNDLTGGIPGELGDLASLTHLFLNNNQLTGMIPAQFADETELPSLADLGLHDNRLETPATLP